MKALQDRADALARAAQKRCVDAIAEHWRRVPGTSVIAGTELVIEARGLRKRRLTDAALRFAGVSR